MNYEAKVESIVKKEERESLYKILFIGLSTYNRILKENSKLLESKSFGELRSRLVRFLIKRQFEEDMLPEDFPYKAEFKKTNNFGNTVVFLKNSTSEIQINKIPKSNRLYNSNKPSRYMLEKAKLNSRYKKEITFFIDADDKVEIKENKRLYVVLGYKIADNKLEYLKFHIPDEYMETSLDCFDAINEYNNMINGDNVDKNVYEDKIIKLKNEAAKVIESE